MQDKIVDPFAKDFRSKMFNQLTEIRKLSTLQRTPPSHRSIFDRRHLPIFNGQFGAGLPASTPAVNMHRLMLIGVEEYDNSKIFKQFWHCPIDSARTAFANYLRPNDILLIQ